MHKAVVVLPVVALMTVTAGACRRSDKKNVPVAQIQTQTEQPMNAPMTVSGCLRAGDATDTYVLTTIGDDRSETATYQLASTGDMKLADHLGERVEVTGVVTGQQSSQTTATIPVKPKATGTAGGTNAPRIETTTELNIRRMDVSSLRPLGGHCAK